MPTEDQYFKLLFMKLQCTWMKHFLRLFQVDTVAFIYACILLDKWIYKNAWNMSKFECTNQMGIGLYLYSLNVKICNGVM